MRDKFDRVVVFVVDAETENPPKFDQKESPPGLLKTIMVAATLPIKNYSTDTIQLLRDKFADRKRFEKNYMIAKKHCAKIAEAKCGAISKD